MTKKPNDSMTKVNFSEEAAYKYVNGVRATIGFKGDLGIYNRFKQLSKRVYGSTCKAFEIYMISFISAVENGVNFCNTVNPVNVEQHIVIERNLRARRKLEFTEDVEVSERVVSCVVCGRSVYALVTRKDDSRVGLCRAHFRRERPGLQGWRVVSEVST